MLGETPSGRDATSMHALSGLVRRRCICKDGTASETTKQAVPTMREAVDRHLQRMRHRKAGRTLHARGAEAAMLATNMQGMQRGYRMQFVQDTTRLQQL